MPLHGREGKPGEKPDARHHEAKLEGKSGIHHHEAMEEEKGWASLEAIHEESRLESDDRSSRGDSKTEEPLFSCRREADTAGFQQQTVGQSQVP